MPLEGEQQQESVRMAGVPFFAQGRGIVGT
jgi:hypothetical protein